MDSLALTDSSSRHVARSATTAPAQMQPEGFSEDVEPSAGATCRICLEDTCTEDNSLQPCLCRGTQQLVHYACLTTWMKQAKQNATVCPVCHHCYHFGRPPLLQSLAVCARGFCCVCVPLATRLVADWTRSAVRQAALHSVKQSIKYCIDAVGGVDEDTKLDYLVPMHALAFLSIESLTYGFRWWMEGMADSMLSRHFRLWYEDELTVPRWPALQQAMAWHALIHAPRVFLETHKFRFEQRCLPKPAWLESGLTSCDTFEDMTYLCMRHLGILCFAVLTWGTVRHCRNEICSYSQVLPCTCPS